MRHQLLSVVVVAVVATSGCGAATPVTTVGGLPAATVVVEPEAFARAGELNVERAAALDPQIRAAREQSMRDIGFSSDEARCMVDALVTLENMPLGEQSGATLLDVYGFCGIPLDRLSGTATSNGAG